MLTNLPREDHQKFDVLVAALESQFGSAHQTELNRAQLRARTRHKEETLPELAEDVDRITCLAYPDAAAGMLHVLARDQFIDALPDEDMRLSVRQNRPSNLKEALKSALELESNQLASRHHHGRGAESAKEVHLEQKKGPEQQQSQQLHDDVLQRMQKCLETFQQWGCLEARGQLKGEGEFQPPGTSSSGTTGKGDISSETVGKPLFPSREMDSSWVCGAKPS